MGRAVVRAEHRNGAVVLLMWAGILAYLDHSGYEYVTGCVVPTHDPTGLTPAGTQVRGVRDFRAAATARRQAHRLPLPAGAARRPGLDAIEPPAWPMRFRAHAQATCGWAPGVRQPAHDPDFGDWRISRRPWTNGNADTRYLTRLRSVSAATELVS